VRRRSDSCARRAEEHQQQAGAVCYGSLGGEDVAPGARACQGCRTVHAAPNPRRGAPDYELALQVGNRDAMSAFLGSIRMAFTQTWPKSSSASLPRRKRDWRRPKGAAGEQERRACREGTQKAQLKAARLMRSG